MPAVITPASAGNPTVVNHRPAIVAAALAQQEVDHNLRVRQDVVLTLIDDLDFILRLRQRRQDGVHDGPMRRAEPSPVEDQIAVIGGSGFYTFLEDPEPVEVETNPETDIVTVFVCAEGGFDDKRLAELGVRVTIDGHGAYFAAIKATYDSLREQRQIFTQASDLSATELTHTYTQPEEYIRWAEEYMSVKE